MRSWVERENTRTLSELKADPRFERFKQTSFEVEEALKGSAQQGLLPQYGAMWLNRGWVYQVRRDAAHPRGLLRRASERSYLARRPQWHPLLDVEAVSAADEQDWTFAMLFFSPSGRRCLIALSLGGSGEIRGWKELDLERAELVKGGFELRAGRHAMAWRDDDTVIIASDSIPGPRGTLGWPLLVKRWSRGKSLVAAPEIFHGEPSDGSVSVWAFDDEASPGGGYIIGISRDDGDEHPSWRLNADDRVEPLPPLLNRHSHAEYRGHVILTLREDWRNGGILFKKGSIVSVPAAEISRPQPRAYEIFSPREDMSVWGVQATRDGVLLHGDELAYGRMWRAQFAKDAWHIERVPLPDAGQLGGNAFYDNRSGLTLVGYEGFLEPPSLYRIDVKRNRATLLASAPPQFDSSGLITELLWATSADGAKVPYSIVRPRALAFDGKAPTIVRGYGSRGGAMHPFYYATLGKLWCEWGGVYVLAHIRGGGERGPAWYVKGVDRQHTYDDMIAVTEDLIRRKITAPKRIAFSGYSAGGLLGGVLLNQRPDLFGAFILEVPLLDQFRLDLGVGGQQYWTGERGEFGDIRKPQVRAFLEQTSPFQNLRPNPTIPKTLLITSTPDINVWPAGVRRFAAKMEALGLPFLFYETADGGHGLAATPMGFAEIAAIEYTYLERQLIDPFR